MAVAAGVGGPAGALVGNGQGISLFWDHDAMSESEGGNVVLWNDLIGVDPARVPTIVASPDAGTVTHKMVTEWLDRLMARYPRPPHGSISDPHTTWPGGTICDGCGADLSGLIYLVSGRSLADLVPGAGFEPASST